MSTSVHDIRREAERLKLHPDDLLVLLNFTATRFREYLTDNSLNVATEPAVQALDDACLALGDWLDWQAALQRQTEAA